MDVVVGVLGLLLIVGVWLNLSPTALSRIYRDRSVDGSGTRERTGTGLAVMRPRLIRALTEERDARRRRQALEHLLTRYPTDPESERACRSATDDRDPVVADLARLYFDGPEAISDDRRTAALAEVSIEARPLFFARLAGFGPDAATFALDLLSRGWMEQDPMLAAVRTLVAANATAELLPVFVRERDRAVSAWWRSELANAVRTLRARMPDDPTHGQVSIAANESGNLTMTADARGAVSLGDKKSS